MEGLSTWTQQIETCGKHLGLQFPSWGQSPAWIWGCLIDPDTLSSACEHSPPRPNAVPWNPPATNSGLAFAQTDLPERIQGTQAFFLARNFCCSASPAAVSHSRWRWSLSASRSWPLYGWVESCNQFCLMSCEKWWVLFLAQAFDCQVRIPRAFFSVIQQPALVQTRILPPPGPQSEDESEQRPPVNPQDLQLEWDLNF